MTTDDFQDLERGAVALAEKLLDKDPDRTAAAKKLAVAKKHLDGAEDRADSAVAALETIAAKLPGASDSARKALVRERTELSAEVLHAPSEVASAAEALAEALIAWAPPVYHAARRRVTALNAQLAPLEHQRNDLRHELDALGGMTKEQAAHLREAGLGVKPEDVGRNDSSRTSLEARLADQSAQIAELKAKRDGFVKLANLALSRLTDRFGQGYGADNLFDLTGKRFWLDGVRGRVSSLVAPWTGTKDALRPLGA